MRVEPVSGLVPATPSARVTDTRAFRVALASGGAPISCVSPGHQSGAVTLVTIESLALLLAIGVGTGLVVTFLGGSVILATAAGVVTVVAYSLWDSLQHLQ